MTGHKVVVIIDGEVYELRKADESLDHLKQLNELTKMMNDLDDRVERIEKGKEGGKTDGPKGK